jgi:hypothetical protein
MLKPVDVMSSKNIHIIEAGRQSTSGNRSVHTYTSNTVQQLSKIVFGPNYSGSSIVVLDMHVGSIHSVNAQLLAPLEKARRDGLEKVAVAIDQAEAKRLTWATR